jgi:hypothetical protein
MLCELKKTITNIVNEIGLKCRTFNISFSGWNFAEAVSRFNANIAYSGLIHAVTQEVKNSLESNILLTDEI